MKLESSDDKSKASLLWIWAREPNDNSPFKHSGEHRRENKCGFRTFMETIPLSLAVPCFSIFPKKRRDNYPDTGGLLTIPRS